MKIEVVKIHHHANSEPTDPEITKLVISGDFDRNNALLKRAREIVSGTGRAEMVASFDSAVGYKLRNGQPR